MTVPQSVIDSMMRYQREWASAVQRGERKGGILGVQAGIATKKEEEALRASGVQIPTLTPTQVMAARGIEVSEAGIGSALTKAAAKILPKVSKKLSTGVAAKAPVTLQTLKTTILTKAQEFLQKPLRTTLPYIAAGGAIGTVADFGEQKATKKAEVGGTIAEVVQPSYLPPTIPTAPILPSVPMVTGIPPVDIMRGVSMAGELVVQPPPFVRTWSTGTANFGVDQWGNHWVTTKRGWKKYSKRKPIVLGTRNPTPQKFIAAAKRYYKLKKDLDKVFKTVRVKRRR